MSETLFSVGTDAVDINQLMREIQETVESKKSRGVYDDARVARAERSNLAYLRNDEQFLGFYLKCLRDAVFVDIGDFEIRERRKLLAPLLVSLKKVIWGLLKFYTYRLWHQQNEVNGLLVTAMEGLDTKHSEKIRKLEERISKLEKEAGISSEQSA